MRLDEIARRAGVASTTVRLYQNRGLLPGPRLVGRTGHYDESHLARLGVISRLAAEGFSLSGIGRLLATAAEGGDLTDLVGEGRDVGEVERRIDALLDRRRPLTLDAAEVLARFPPGTIEPEHIQRAVACGLIESTGDGRLRVPDERFLETGAALAGLGIPVEVILDEWEHLGRATDGIAARFVATFESHFLPDDPGSLDADQLAELTATLARLVRIAGQVTAAGLDASLARLTRRRLAELTDGVAD